MNTIYISESELVSGLGLQSRQLLDMFSANMPDDVLPIQELPVVEIRKNIHSLLVGLGPAKLNSVNVQKQIIDADGDQIALYIHTPSCDKPENGWPVVLFFHGGGWVIGEVDPGSETVA